MITTIAPPGNLAIVPSLPFVIWLASLPCGYPVRVRRWLQFVLIAFASTALAQQTVTGTVVSPHRGQITSPRATISHAIDEQSCTAKGSLFISVSGDDEHQQNAIVAKLQLIDPNGKRIGPKDGSEDIVNEMASGSGFSWEALDDDEDPNAPPEVPHGVFEICNPTNGTWHFEGKALVNGSYTIEIAAYSMETLDSRGIPQSTSSHDLIQRKTTMGTTLSIPFRYSRAQNDKVSFVLPR